MPHIKPRTLHSQHGVGYHGSFLGVADEALAINDIVIATGYSGDRIKFSKADANANGLDSGLMGIADHAAPSGGSVRVVSHKLITAVNTIASEGAGYPVYLSNTPGAWSVTGAIIVGSVLLDDAAGAVVLSPANIAARTNSHSGILVAPATATTTLTAADSGKTVFMTPNACAITLPAPVVGLNFRLIQTGNFATAAGTIATPTTDNSVFFVGGYASADSGDGNTSATGSTNDVITFGSATLAGDFVELMCLSSTTWHAVGYAKSSDNTDGVVFSTS